MDLKKWVVTVEQNGGEYHGNVYIKSCELLHEAGSRTLVADGVEIVFDENIVEVKEFKV